MNVCESVGSCFDQRAGFVSGCVAESSSAFVITPTSRWSTMTVHFSPTICPLLLFHLHNYLSSILPSSALVYSILFYSIPYACPKKMLSKLCIGMFPFFAKHGSDAKYLTPFSIKTLFSIVLAHARQLPDGRLWCLDSHNILCDILRRLCFQSPLLSSSWCFFLFLLSFSPEDCQQKFSTSLVSGVIVVCMNRVIFCLWGKDLDLIRSALFHHLVFKAFSKIVHFN